MAVVTNISEEHLEHLGDLNDVAREEFSILACLRDRSFVAVDHEAMRHSPTDALRGRAVLTYGTSDDADLRAVDLRADERGYTFRLNGRYQYRVPLLGTHNAINALGAIAIGARFRMTDEEIARGLVTVKPAPMRLEHRRLGSVTLINDAYNANPASMKAAFSVMDGLTDSKRKVLVLGDMAELGDQAERCHREIGREAGRSGAHVIVAAGAYARVVADGATVAAGTTKRIYAYPNLEALGGKIRSLIKPGDAVLLKASRRARFERLIPSIEAAAETASQP